MSEIKKVNPAYPLQSYQIDVFDYFDGVLKLELDNSIEPIEIFNNVILNSKNDNLKELSLFKYDAYTKK